MLLGRTNSSHPPPLLHESSLSISIDMLHNIIDFSSLQSCSIYDWMRENGCTSTQSKRYILDHARYAFAIEKCLIARHIDKHEGTRHFKAV